MCSSLSCISCQGTLLYFLPGDGPVFPARGRSRLVNLADDPSWRVFSRGEVFNSQMGHLYPGAPLHL